MHNDNTDEKPQCKTQLMKYTQNPPLYYCMTDKPYPYSCRYVFTFGTACFCKHPDNADFAAPQPQLNDNKDRT